MKKAFILTVLALLVVTVGLASANTIVAGKIYNADFSDTIAEADVSVSCDHEGTITVNTTKSLDDGISGKKGTYAVEFEDSQCGDDDEVTVDASKDGLTGSSTGTILDGTLIGLDLNLGIVNVALIPEFGIAAGALTLISAIAVFFFIRKK